MNEIRNPFRLRASENIETDEMFIRLFSPKALDALQKDDIWIKLQIIRSTPGGGKTSLLRLFTPHSLKTVYEQRNQPFCEKLFSDLKNIGAIDDNGPLVLGVYLNAKDFWMLDELAIEDVKKQRLLLSLINSRFLIGILKGIKVLNRLQDLSFVAVEDNKLDLSSYGYSLTLDANSLLKWAKNIEKEVLDALDSFEFLEKISLPGHNSLILDTINDNFVLQINECSINKVLLMLDDVHLLTQHQRRFLFGILTATRDKSAVWLAERIENLDPNEIIPQGSKEGRDYILIEDCWRASKKPSSFKDVVEDIANRRVEVSRFDQITSYSGCLQEALDDSEWNKVFINAREKIKQRLYQRITHKIKYDEWIEEREEKQGKPYDLLIAWRTLEIKIERDLEKKQTVLFDEVLGIGKLEEKEATLRSAAEILISREFGVPYYYGFSRIVKIAFDNLEQFLWIAGEIFQEALTAALMKKNYKVSPESQQRILTQAIRSRWDKLHLEIRFGAEIRRFLDGIGRFAQRETDRPTAPYKPGVTGIAISMEDRTRLIDSDRLNENKDLIMLKKIISLCISNNLVKVIPNYKDKAGLWMVIYLNRLLCVHFGLPLQYGGWKEKSLQELCSWISAGIIEQKGGGLSHVP